MYGEKMQLKNYEEEISFICRQCGKKTFFADACIDSYGMIICKECIKKEKKKKKIRKEDNDKQEC